MIGHKLMSGQLTGLSPVTTEEVSLLTAYAVDLVPSHLLRNSALTTLFSWIFSLALSTQTFPSALKHVAIKTLGNFPILLPLLFFHFYSLPLPVPPFYHHIDISREGHS